MWQFRALGACNAPGSFTYEEIREKYNLQQSKIIQAYRSIRNGQTLFKDLTSKSTDSFNRNRWLNLKELRLSSLYNVTDYKLCLHKLRSNWANKGQIAADRFRESRPLCPVISLLNNTSQFGDQIGSSQPEHWLEDRIKMELLHANKLWEEQQILQGCIESDLQKLKGLSVRINKESACLSAITSFMSQFWRAPEDIMTSEMISFSHDLQKCERRYHDISSDCHLDSLALARVTSEKMLDSVVNLTECCGQLSGELKKLKESMLIGIDNHIDPVKLATVIHDAMGLEHKWRTEGLTLLKKDIFTSNGRFRPASWPRFLPTTVFYYKLNPRFVLYKPIKMFIERKRELKNQAKIAKRMGYSLDSSVENPNESDQIRSKAIINGFSSAFSPINNVFRTEISVFSDSLALYRKLLPKPIIDDEVRHHLNDVQNHYIKKDRMRSDYGDSAIDIWNTLHLLKNLNKKGDW